MLKWWLLKQGKKVRGGWMREATGGGGAMCGRGGGWICLLCYLIQAASHTNTICHHSHLKSAACTGLLGTAGYWLLQEGVRSPPSACGLHRSHGVCVTSRSGGGGVGPVICRAASAALWWFSARGEEQGGCRGGRDRQKHSDAVTHGWLYRLHALTAAPTFHSSGNSRGWTLGCWEMLLGVWRLLQPPSRIKHRQTSPEKTEDHTLLIGQPADHIASFVSPILAPPVITCSVLWIVAGAAFYCKCGNKCTVFPMNCISLFLLYPHILF